MPMNRILEFSPSNEEAVVSRVLVLVHQTVDEHFPNTAQTNRQFTKTVFSDDGENTALSHLPSPAQFALVEDTSPGDAPTEQIVPPPTEPVRLPPLPSQTSAVIPPPPSITPVIVNTQASVKAPSEKSAAARSLAAKPTPSSNPVTFSALPSRVDSQLASLERPTVQEKLPRRWTIWITIAILVGSLAILSYVLLTPA